MGPLAADAAVPLDGPGPRQTGRARHFSKGRLTVLIRAEKRLLLIVVFGLSTFFCRVFVSRCMYTPVYILGRCMYTPVYILGRCMYTPVYILGRCMYTAVSKLGRCMYTAVSKLG